MRLGCCQISRDHPDGVIGAKPLAVQNRRVDVDRAREFHGPRDYLDLAQSDAATAEELRWLADSPYSFVVLAVARHPSTPSDVLERLLPDDSEAEVDSSILRALAEHRSSSVDLLVSIARRVPPLLHVSGWRGWRHDGFAAGIALFRNPIVPDELLFRLLDDPEVTTEFRKVAARETTHASVLERLRHDRSERVRRAARRNVASESSQ